MNPRIHEQTEALISHSLDGELDATKQVELSRELLRNRDARKVHDDYQARDQIVAEALRGKLDRPGRLSVQFRPRPRTKIEWSALVTSGWAVAAAIMLAAGLWVWIERNTPEADLSPSMATTSQLGNQSNESGTHANKTPQVIAAPALDTPEDHLAAETDDAVMGGELVDKVELATWVDKAPEGQRALERSFLGIFDDAGEKFLFLEVDREETRIGSGEEEL